MADLFNSAYVLNKHQSIIGEYKKWDWWENKWETRKQDACKGDEASQATNQVSSSPRQISFFVLEFYLFLISNEYHIFNILVYNN